jgi:uncharacterized membrane protein/protein-disulfide isomerase
MKQDIKKILEPKSNGPEIAIALASLLKVKISDTTLTREIDQHPDNPSLLSISDVLNTYGVENLGIRFDESRFAEIPVPFVTQINGVKINLNFFTIVKEIKDGLVRFIDPEKRGWSTLVIQDFIERCSGVALLMEVGDDAGEKDYLKSRREEKKQSAKNYLTALSIPAIFIIACILTLANYGTSFLLPVVFSMLTLAGAITTTLLLWYELDQHNPILKQICSAGKKVDCGAVLQSKASKIAGISWSVIGFSYFMGLLLFLLFEGITRPSILFIVTWINAIAVPYVAFSIYYQWKVVKQWCVLCLSVQAILLLQLANALLGGWHTLLSINTIELSLIIPAITAFAIPLITTALLIPAMQKARQSKRFNTELQKLKHNKQIFEALLQKQKQVTEDPDGLGIVVGNPNAAFKLIKVCNPFCRPCAKAHSPMEALLHNNPDVQIQLIFTATNKEDDVSRPPVIHLLAIAENSEEPVLKQALDDWYLAENKNYETFAAKYPMNGELKKQEPKIDNMRNWCIKTGIPYTPTFFISIPGVDGAIRYYQMPEMYSVADLKYFFSV